MVLDSKFERTHLELLRDTRPMYMRLADWMKRPANSFVMFTVGIVLLHLFHAVLYFADIIFLVYIIYFWWLWTRERTLPFKMPLGSPWPDKNNEGPGRSGKGEGILFVGNKSDTNEELWFTNSDARTHILYLGTTGAGKTEGLKSMATNAMAWASGFVYIDGKADTDLWSSLSSLVRRFGRDDDLLVLNYMTGNSDVKAPSNTMNPFSSGSASYLTQMLVSLMPDAEGDNAMWKERAVSLISSVMPALTWKRDHQDIPMSVSTIREYLNLPNVIKLSRDKHLPDKINEGIMGYLDTLPGYIDAAYGDDGQPKPPGPDVPQVDTTTPSQQHGYLSMQFTRALQSLGDEYGYIFDTQAADVDMVDVVLNRRILIVLIPALEKSSDETANLGKIVAATIKGMMGSALGATVEGESSTVIENKPTNSSTPFMTVFDEVGYYTAQGMAVMAAQARSLGFCLIFAAQDLPALQKRVKEEARSITANCNLKIFGKLEDPTDTKDFFEKTIGSAMVMEASGYQLSGGASTGSYFDTQQAGLQLRARATYDDLRDLKEGEALITFGTSVNEVKIFYSNPGHAKAMRVTRFLSLPPPDENLLKHADTITRVRDLMVHKTWTAKKADVALETPDEIAALAEYCTKAEEAGHTGVETGMIAIAGVYALSNQVDLTATGQGSGAAKGGAQGGGGKAPAAPAKAAPNAQQNTPPQPQKKEPPQSAQQKAAPQSQQPQTPPAQQQQPPADAKSADGTGVKTPPDNPLAGFSKNKEGGTPLPQQPSQQGDANQGGGNTAPPPQQPPPSTPPADNAQASQQTGNQAGDDANNNAAPPEAKSSVNWQELIDKGAEGGTPAAGDGQGGDSQAGDNTGGGAAPDAAQSSGSHLPDTPIDPEAANILKRAGRTMRDSLFRKGGGGPPDDDGDAQAAE